MHVKVAYHDDAQNVGEEGQDDEEGEAAVPFAIAVHGTETGHQAHLVWGLKALACQRSLLIVVELEGIGTVNVLVGHLCTLRQVRDGDDHPPLVTATYARRSALGCMRRTHRGDRPGGVGRCCNRSGRSPAVDSGVVQSGQWRSAPKRRQLKLLTCEGVPVDSRWSSTPCTPGERPRMPICTAARLARQGVRV